MMTLLLAAAVATADPDKALIKQAEAAVVAELRDPGSAQFADERVLPSGAVCGTYNARNGYGGYAGSTPFVYAPPGATIHVLMVMDGPDAGAVAALGAPSATEETIGPSRGRGLDPVVNQDEGRLAMGDAGALAYPSICDGRQQAKHEEDDRPLLTDRAEAAVIARIGPVAFTGERSIAGSVVCGFYGPSQTAFFYSEPTPTVLLTMPSALPILTVRTQVADTALFDRAWLQFCGTPVAP